MKSSPVRRLFAWFGLIAIAPIGYLVFTGRMTAGDAGTKAALIFVVVIVAVRFVEFAISGVAAVLERRPPVVHHTPEQ